MKTWSLELEKTHTIPNIEKLDTLNYLLKSIQSNRAMMLKLKSEESEHVKAREDKMLYEFVLVCLECHHKERSVYLSRMLKGQFNQVLQYIGHVVF